MPRTRYVSNIINKIGINCNYFIMCECIMYGVVDFEARESKSKAQFLGASMHSLLCRCMNEREKNEEGFQH